MKLNKFFFKKFFLVCGCLFLALIAIFAIAYTVLNIKWGRDLRCELEKLKASGVPMTIRDIAPPSLPPAENASVEYQQIFSLMTDGTSSMNNSGGNSMDLKELYTLSHSKKETVDDFENQCSANAVRIREILGKDSFRQIFELCQKAAAKPGMNFNLPYEDGPSLLMPHLSSLREISRLICLKAEMEMLEGQRDKAWETILTGLKLSLHSKTEPLLISQLIYYACSNIYLDFISQNLSRYGIRQDQAEKIVSELAPERTAYAQSMKKAIDGESVCFGGWVFERILSGSLSSSEFCMIAGNKFAGSYFMPLLFLYRPFAKKDYQEYLKIMGGYRAEYNQPYYRTSADSMLNDDEMLLNHLPKYCILTRMIAPSLHGLRLKTAKIETRSQEIRILLALEEYKNLNGAYPEKLALLAPKFLPEIPVSDLTGLPFGYSKGNGGYEISGSASER